MIDFFNPAVDAYVEEIDGAGGDDWILGNSGANILDFRQTQLIGITGIDGGDGNDTIFGSSGADLLRGNLGSDRLYGGDGGDTYRIHPDEGVDRIQDGGVTTDTDTLYYADGVVEADLWLVRNGSELRIYRLGSSDEVEILNWFSDPTEVIERIVLDNGKVLLAAQVGDLTDVMTAIGTPIQENPTIRVPG